MHDDWQHDYLIDLDNQEHDEHEISDEEFCRSMQWFFEGIPDEDLG